MRTQVGIVGAGPAGLLLSHLLHLQGISSVILEARDRPYIENRIRAGVLEQGTVDILTETGVGDRMLREGLYHRGTSLRFQGANHEIDFVALTGKAVRVYAQHEVVKDLVAARLAADGDIRFEAQVGGIEGLQGDRAAIHFTQNGTPQTLECDFIAGCDGFHGPCKEFIPTDLLQTYDRVYPFGWLGILAQAPPSQDELIYANHDRGFALYSMRSPEITRHYIQVPPDEDLALWPDERIWEELHLRLSVPGNDPVIDGPILQKTVTAMRSFVQEPMRYGRLFLAGDAAHIVPPTGAKGMNLAVADVRVMSQGLDSFYRTGSTALLDRYSEICLRRVWRAQHFSWWMTSMLHKFGPDNDFDRHRQMAELQGVVSSEAGQKYLAENYVGIPFET